jgi:hypothetical protein
MTDDDVTLYLGGARVPEPGPAGRVAVSPPCVCKLCLRQFTFVAGFTPAIDVCYFCAPLDTGGGR